MTNYVFQLQGSAVSLVTHLVTSDASLLGAARSVGNLLDACTLQQSDLAPIARYFQTDMEPSLQAIQEATTVIHDAEKGSLALLGIDLSEALAGLEGAAPPTFPDEAAVTRFFHKIGLAPSTEGPVSSIARWHPGDSETILFRMKPLRLEAYRQYVSQSDMFQRGMYAKAARRLQVLVRCFDPNFYEAHPGIDQYFQSAKNAEGLMPLPDSMQSLLLGAEFFESVTKAPKERPEFPQAFLGLVLLNQDEIPSSSAAQLPDYYGFRMASPQAWPPFNNFPLFFTPNKDGMSEEEALERGGYQAGQRKEEAYRVFAKDYPELTSILFDYNPFKGNPLDKPYRMYRVQRLLYEAWRRMSSYPQPLGKNNSLSA